MSEIRVSLKELDNMKHTIGFSRDQVKRGKYKAYRNYYCSGSQGEPELEPLVANGLMAKWESYNKDIFYKVTPKGMEYLSKALSVVIVEVD